MIGSVSANRRAHAFAQLLVDSRPKEPGGEEGGAAPSAGEQEQAALLAVADRLAALPRPELAAETRAAQRAALLAAMDAAAPGGAAESQAPSGLLPGQRACRSARGAHRAAPAGGLSRLKPRTRLTKGLAAGGLTMGVAAGAFGGVAAASTDALPGDTLYGLKRGMEDLRLDFASGDIDRGRVYLDQASTRLNEARRLLERQRAGELDEGELDDIRRALAGMRDAASEGHRLLSHAYQEDGSIDPIESLSAFAEGHRATWAEVRRQLPPELRDVSHEVTDVFDAMDDDLAPLQPLLPRETHHTASAEGEAGRSLRPPDGQTPPGSLPPGSPGSHSRPDSPGGTAAEESPADGDRLLDAPGLLSPPSDAPEESPTETGPPHSALPEPEITVPPLVDDLLPSLGLDGEEEATD
ncbi:DUF5667 domain-containing protein [Streptomyces hoynatensis]|uniref:DUF5667 domain-containing protein n=1 Tax=Streptomyces hoynatensis TaxID=1141874 RepID=A0A3A9Z0Z5_9ACTN|nr:DUF5667 domain-containing protein [Streptomyces hoynatensis]RKN41918.1 hypothetical protein D7294_15590 [Streptomyces hoynatensis]